MSSTRHWIALLSLVSVLSPAEKAAVKIEDIAASDDTSIVIQKGKPKQSCVAYQIVEGTQEVPGLPEYDRSKALGSWQTACSDFKKEFKENNKDNRIIALSCGQSSPIKEGDQYIFKSVGNYKVRVRMEEP